MTEGSAYTDQPRRTARDRIVAVVRVLLVAVWVVWAALVWWAAPRSVSNAQAEREIAAGQVVGYVRAEGWTGNGPWFEQRRPRQVGDGSEVVWRTSGWRVHWTTVGTPATSDLRAGAEAMAARMEAAGGHWNPVVVEAPARTAGIAAGVLMVSCLAVVIFGSAPVRGTRWFWFWVSLIAGGAGVLAWLLTERPWSRRAAASPAAAALDAGSRDVPGRRSGWTGFLYGILAAIGLSLLGAGLRSLGAGGDW
jgi:hypothetical protein